MDENERLQKVKKVIDVALRSYSNEPTFYWYDGKLNIQQAWNGIGTYDYLNFSNSEEFTDYLKENCRSLNLIGKIKISSRKAADKIALAEELIESFSHLVIDEANAKSDDVVIRTKYGTRPPVFYRNLSSKIKNTLKTAYAHTQKIKYVDVRPCLYKNWITWDEERQMASCKDK